MAKVTMIELITKTHLLYTEEIRDYESKRNGNPEVENAVDKLTEPLKEKLATLEVMYEIETGKPMFAD